MPGPLWFRRIIGRLRVRVLGKPLKSYKQRNRKRFTLGSEQLAVRALEHARVSVADPDVLQAARKVTLIHYQASMDHGALEAYARAQMELRKKIGWDAYEKFIRYVQAIE